jgi:hypothetical protein
MNSRLHITIHGLDYLEYSDKLPPQLRWSYHKTSLLKPKNLKHIGLHRSNIYYSLLVSKRTKIWNLLRLTSGSKCAGASGQVSSRQARLRQDHINEQHTQNARSCMHDYKESSMIINVNIFRTATYQRKMLSSLSGTSIVCPNGCRESL